jgi:5'-3' exonuclease
MQVHLIDGTYELFRCYFGAPSAINPNGQEVGATKGLLLSFAAWLRAGEITHVAAAFDTVIESFRNELFSGYKTSAGIDPNLYSQFPLAERATRALGIPVWSMVDFEADDALATGAHIYNKIRQVKQVVLCSPDKDLAQCVTGQKVVCLDRMRKNLLNEEGVVAKFGVAPASIPDLLALVGDTADGIPGVSRWGMKSAASLLHEYGCIENIPKDYTTWRVKVRGASALAETLFANFEDALLYKKLATLRLDVPLKETLDDLAWRGADRNLLEPLCEELGERAILDRITKWK